MASYEINYPEDTVRWSDSRVPDSMKLKGESEHPRNLYKHKNKRSKFFETYNINSLIQVGKLKTINSGTT